MFSYSQSLDPFCSSLEKEISSFFSSSHHLLMCHMKHIQVQRHHLLLLKSQLWVSVICCLSTNQNVYVCVWGGGDLSVKSCEPSISSAFAFQNRQEHKKTQKDAEEWKQKQQRRRTTSSHKSFTTDLFMFIYNLRAAARLASHWGGSESLLDCSWIHGASGTTQSFQKHLDDSKKFLLVIFSALWLQINQNARQEMVFPPQSVRLRDILLLTFFSFQL